jgi:O-antigen/teichoic acid export membrane protein
MGSALLFSVSSITIYNFVLAQSICYLITFSLALWLIRKQLKSILPVFDLSYILDILKRSAPYALLVLLMMLYNRSDVVILKQISSDGNYQAGIYAQGYRLLDAFYMLGMIFAGLLFPVFSRMIHQHSKDLMALVQVTGKLLIGGAIGILFIVNYNGSYILHLIYGDKVDNESITVFFYLMLAFAAMSFNFIFGTLLTAGGFLKSLNFSALLGVIISVFSNIYLIPTMGALGCAISAFITQAFVSLVLVIISARSLQVYFNIRSIISFVLYAGSIFTIKQFVPLSISAGSSLWLDITLVLVFSFVFSIIDFNSLRKIWKLKEDTQ